MINCVRSDSEELDASSTLFKHLTCFHSLYSSGSVHLFFTINTTSCSSDLLFDLSPLTLPTAPCRPQVTDPPPIHNLLTCYKFQIFLLGKGQSSILLWHNKRSLFLLCLKWINIWNACRGKNLKLHFSRCDCICSPVFWWEGYWKECCEWRLLSNVPSGVTDTDCLALPVCSTKSHLRLRYNRWLGSRPNCDRIQSVQFSHYHPSVSARLVTWNQDRCALHWVLGVSRMRCVYDETMMNWLSDNRHIHHPISTCPGFPNQGVANTQVFIKVLVYLLMPNVV